MLRSARSDAYLVAAAASWGLGTVLTKYALGGFDPTLLLPFQLACSVLLLTCFLLMKGASLGTVSRPLKVAALGVLNPGVAYALALVGLSRIDASVSVIIWATEPIVIVLLAYLFLRERITRVALVSLVAAMVGVALIVGSPSSGATLAGIALTFAAVLACALYSVLLRLMRLSEGTLPIVLIQQLSALSFAVIALLVVEAPQISVGTPTSAETFSAVCAGGLYYGVAFLLYVAGLRRTSAARAGVFLTLVPVFGLVFSVALLGETVGLGGFIGAITVVAAMGFLGVMDSRRSQFSTAER